MFKKMNIRTTEKEFLKLFADLDTDGDGSLSFSEFLTGIRWLQKGVTLDWQIFASRARADSDDDDEGDDDQGAAQEILDLNKKLKIYTQVCLFFLSFFFVSVLLIKSVVVFCYYYYYYYYDISTLGCLCKIVLRRQRRDFGRRIAKLPRLWCL